MRIRDVQTSILMMISLGAEAWVEAGAETAETATQWPLHRAQLPVLEKGQGF
eukprot:GDKH01016389.1.p4 GENE.GDKH01016389.1~~GDKH01016389.1.p4  ORF type:complete len:52 (-),score=2.95 GDKH01016389.1:219-374(-)